MPWLVAVSEWSRQSCALESLGLLDLPTYAPRYRSTLTRCGKRVRVLRYLFGRYLFVTMTEGWRSITSARGVAGILLSPDLDPLLVRDDVIDEIRSREDEDGAICMDRLQKFRKGQSVTPLSGPFTGQIGVFDKMTSRDREVALFSFMGIMTTLEFAPGTLVASQETGLSITAAKRAKKRRQRRSSKWKSADEGQVTHYADM